MDGLSKEFFTSSAFPFNEEAAVIVSILTGFGNDFLHGGIVRINRLKGIRRLIAGHAVNGAK